MKTVFRTSSLVAVSLIVSVPSVMMICKTLPSGTLVVVPLMTTASSSLEDKLPSPIGSVTTMTGAAVSMVSDLLALAVLPARSLPVAVMV